MADYDVSVVELTTPAVTAPLAQTRPVVSVRNNGLHDAVASGYVRIYSAGLLIYESEVYSDTIGPGETRPASAVDLWTPPAEGVYMVQGYVSTPLDQVEPNNNLWPTDVTISGIEPPPPTPVPLHASQHEQGGADETSIEDLPGRAADQQRPINHASNHENGGIDRVDVTDLPGVLGEGQTPKAHATSHKTGGGDALSVLALPDVTDLELLAHKGANNGYASLDSEGYVPHEQLAFPVEPPGDPDWALTFGRVYGPSIPKQHAASHQSGGSDPLNVAGLSGLLADPQYSFYNRRNSGTVVAPGGGAQYNLAWVNVDPYFKNETLHVHIDAYGHMAALGNPGQILRLSLYRSEILMNTLDVPQALGATFDVHIRGAFVAVDATNLRAAIVFHSDDTVTHASPSHESSSPTDFPIGSSIEGFSLRAMWINENVGSSLNIDFGAAYCLGQRLP